MHAVVKACGAALLGLLSNGCDNFCDAYPEACDAATAAGGAGGAAPSGAGAPGGGSAGGGSAEGGAGGETPVGPFDVTVSLVDFAGNSTPNAPVLVSNADGSVLELTDTGSGELKVSVPDHGRLSLFHDDGSTKLAFSAEVVAGVTSLAFRLPTDLNQPVLQVVVSSTCSGNCGATREVSVSCRDNETIADTTSPYSHSVQTFYGCPGSSLFDAFVVAYAPDGQALAAASAYDQQSSVELHSLGALSPLVSAETADVSLQITGLLPGFSAKRRVINANDDRPGFGFSRATESDEPVVSMSLVEDFLPDAWAELAVTTTPTQVIARREHIGALNGDLAVAFDVGSLAIPSIPEAVDLTTPGQPLASFELGQGPIGDAVQLILYRGTSLRWSVVTPAAASGEVLLPDLPPELQSYAFSQVDDFVIGHVDADDLDGYAAWANEGVIMPFDQATHTQTQAISN